MFRFLSALAASFLVTVLCGCTSWTGPARPAMATGEASQELPSSTRSRTVQYDVLEALTVTNRGPGQPSKHNLWIALIRDVPPYQTVSTTEISPDSYQPVGDEFGNQYAEFDLTGMPPGTSVSIEIRYRVAVHELDFDLTDCEGEVPEFYTGPELHVESKNPQIIRLAQDLSKGEPTACDRVKAFYNHIGNRLVYSYNGANWGAQAALGEMGADCTEYSSLLMALSRASGLPARYLEGIRVLGVDTEEEARVEHAWLEVYLPGIGWTPMDPTLGRSSLNREKYFARTPPDRIVVTVGRNPSTLRGASYFTHLYWPGTSAEILVERFEWAVTRVED